MQRNESTAFGSTAEGLARECSNRHAAGRVLAIFGYVLILSGCFHFFVWLWMGGAWEGALSWRKPILFGLSGGVTLVSMSQLIGMLKGWQSDQFVASLLAGTMTCEVGLITIQQWRGVESHFNRATPADRLIDTLLTVMITIVAACILLLSVRAFLYLRASRPQKTAWRGGLIFLLLSCAIGFMIFFYGAFRISQGVDPTTLGEAGVVKFPHGLAIHTVQLFPLLSWLLSRLEVPSTVQVNALRSINYSTACLLTYSLLQTLSGRSRTDFTPMSGIALLSAAAFASPLLLAVAMPVAARIRAWTTPETSQ